MPTVIRPASTSEIEKVVSLWKDFMGDPTVIEEPIPTQEGNVRKQAEFISEMIKEDPKQVLVAEDNGQLVGYLLFKREQKGPFELQRKLSYIYDLYVRPSHRRKGVGKSLMRACLDDLRSAEPRQVRLNVWTKNKSATGLYRKMGFGDYLIVMKADAGPER
jgi:ribosomal protein S18 acetylase RimI-like enzyme